MTTTAERIQVADLRPAEPRGARGPLGVLAAAAAVGLAGLSLTQVPGSPSQGQYVRVAVVALWALCGLSLILRRPREPMGFLMTGFAVSGAVWAYGAAVRTSSGGAAARAIGFALLPAIMMHIIFGLPDGHIAKQSRRVMVLVGYGMSLAVAVYEWTQRPKLPLWPVAIVAALALLAGAGVSTSRYNRSRGLERQRMQWFGWAMTVATAVAVLSAATRLLVDWPTNAIEVAAVAAIPIPLALAFGATTKFVGRVDRLLAQTVSIAGLTGVVVLTYILIVLGLGRVPTHAERTLLLLSMIAAIIAALLYLPTRERLTSLANRIVYGERQAPDEVLRTFGSRMSRAIPLDELLLQMAESLRKTLALDLVEVWTGSQGSLERRVCDPDRPVIHMTVGEKEQPVVTRAGVSGPAWIKVWLPQLLEGRESSMVRVAPITHQGDLLGMIVVERRDPDEQFGEENERVMTELARQVGLALHNSQLDTALQASLVELQKRAEDLRASRERIVAAGDAERRKLERNLHDGAQQHLVALAVKVKLVKNLVEADPNTAKSMLEELGGDVQEAVQQLRDLAHGIYPPILVDRGLGPALESAATKAALPTSIVADGVQRHRQEVEAAVYFCVLEALQNAGKHAGEGASAVVRVWEESGALLFQVTDDGAGFDASAKGLGAGFTNMSDRLGAIGGTLGVESAPGGGTTISGRVPLNA
ncbi:MAG: histidine kinase [Actinomycetota bacterium]